MGEIIEKTMLINPEKPVHYDLYHLFKSDYKTHDYFKIVLTVSCLLIFLEPIKLSTYYIIKPKNISTE